jgi:hypothetical protein
MIENGPFLSFGSANDFIRSLAPFGWWRYGLGITQASGKASVWADQSGHNNDLVQATGISQPAVQADNSLLCDGVNDWMQASLSLPVPYTMYFAFKEIVFNARVIGGARCIGALDAVIFQTLTTPQLRLNQNPTTPDTTIAVGSWGVCCGVVNGVSSVYQAAQNGVTGTVNGSTVGNADTTTAFAIGAGANGLGTSPSNTAFKEAILFGAAHDAATRLTVLRYLGAIAGVNVP